MPVLPEILEGYATPTAWDRFWARSFDTVLYLTPLLVITPAISQNIISFVFGFPIEVRIFLKQLAPVIYQANLVIACGGWVFIEALLLSLYGTTPGKTLVKIKILNQDSSKLTYWQALQRTLQVYCFGCCFGIPVLSLLANLISFIYFKKHRKAFWDKNQVISGMARATSSAQPFYSQIFDVLPSYNQEVAVASSSKTKTVSSSYRPLIIVIVCVFWSVISYLIIICTLGLSFLMFIAWAMFEDEHKNYEYCKPRQNFDADCALKVKKYRDEFIKTHH